MSAPVRTEPLRLSLVRPGEDGRRPARPSGDDRLHLAPSPPLAAFAGAAADGGLGLEDAARLAIERALALCDAGIFPFDVESARRRLQRSARSARAQHVLSAAQADYVRSLIAARPRPAADTSSGVTLVLPDRLLTRARSEIDGDCAARYRGAGDGRLGGCGNS